MNYDTFCGRLEIQHGDWVSFPHETDGRLVIGRVINIIHDDGNSIWNRRIYTEVGLTRELAVTEVRRTSVPLLSPEASDP